MFDTQSGKFNFVTLLSPYLRCDVGNSDRFHFEMTFHFNLCIGVVDGKLDFMNLLVKFSFNTFFSLTTNSNQRWLSSRSFSVYFLREVNPISA